MTWEQEAHHAAALFDKGDYVTAGNIFKRLSESSELTELNRAMMAVNLARVHEKLGALDSARACFDYAATLLVRPYVWVQETRAAFLYDHGQIDEAVAIWEELLALHELQPDRRAAIEYNWRVVQEARTRPEESQSSLPSPR